MKSKKIFMIVLLSMIFVTSAPVIIPKTSITVHAAAPKISKKSATLIKGKTLQLKVSGTKGNKILWSSSRKSVATVNSKGKVTAKKAGTTTIAAKVGKKKLTCKITVEAPKLSKSSLVLTVGKSQTIKLNGTKQRVTWKSSNSSIASVKNGKITAKKSGKATITATVLKKKYSCKVTVPEVYSLPANQIIYNKNDVKIRTKGIETDSENVKLKIYIENKSNLNLGFNAHSFAVNGIMTNESIYYMDLDVPAGKKAQTTLDIKKAWLRKHNMKDIKNVDILFWAYDNDKHFKEFDTSCILLGSGKRKRLSGTSIYNGNDIIVKYVKTDGNKLYFSVLNKSKEFIDVSIENTSVNDWAYNKWILNAYNEQILPNCEKLFEIEIDDKFLADNSISKIKKFEFGFEVRYNDDYMNTVHTGSIVAKIV